MLVTPFRFVDARQAISSAPYIALDTETTGLRAYNGDRLFAIIIATIKEVFYFDFVSTLDRRLIPDLLSFFRGTIFMHNAKFDMHMCANEGLLLDKFDIHCTEAIARVIKNDNFKYSLEALTGAKSNSVKEYCNKHKLYEQTEDGKRYFFDKVPLDVMQPYAENDARITFSLGMSQLAALSVIQTEINNNPGIKKTSNNIITLFEQEKALTPVLFRMERRGVRINVAYVKEAFNFETAKYQNCAKEFERISNIPFKDSNKVLAQAFTNAGERYPTTGKGNPSFRDEVLEKMSSPLARILQDYRHSRMMANTFLKNLLEYRDTSDRIHANFKQGGTATGRMSCSEPNLQNVPAKGEDQAQYPIRACFVAEPDHYWFSIDWKAMEYRLMLDIAGEITLINAIKKGLDVHQATATMIGVSRDQAKAINFALLYGVGNAKLGKMIGVSEAKAGQIRQVYYSKLPNVAAFLRNVQRVAENRKFVINTYGRKLLFKDRDFAYKAPNYLIQGGCGDIMKRALIGIDDLLSDTKSYVFLTVHDEADLMIHKDELYLLDGIKTIMESIYQYKHLPMAVDMEYSTTNWFELKEWKNESIVYHEGQSSLMERSGQGIGDRDYYRETN